MCVSVAFKAFTTRLQEPACGYNTRMTSIRDAAVSARGTADTPPVPDRKPLSSERDVSLFLLLRFSSWVLPSISTSPEHLEISSYAFLTHNKLKCYTKTKSLPRRRLG